MSYMIVGGREVVIVLHDNCDFWCANFHDTNGKTENQFSRHQRTTLEHLVHTEFFSTPIDSYL